MAGKGEFLKAILTRIFLKSASEAEKAAARTATTGMRIGTTEAAEGTAKVGARVGAESAESLAARMTAMESKMAAEAAEAATRNSWTGYQMLKQKVFYGAIAVWAADSATGTHLQRNVLKPAVSLLLQGVAAVLPGITTKDVAVKVGETAGTMAGYGVDTAVGGGIQALEDTGHHDAARVGKFTYLTAELIPFAASIALEDKDKREAKFWDNLDKRDITPDDLTVFLSSSPWMVSQIEEHGVDLHSRLPGLDKAIAARKVAMRVDPAVTPVAEASTAFGDAARMQMKAVIHNNLNASGKTLTAAWEKVTGIIDSGKVDLDLGIGFSIVRWFVDKLKSVPILGDWITNFALDMVNDELVGMETGALKSRTPQFAPAPAPALG